VMLRFPVLMSGEDLLSQSDTDLGRRRQPHGVCAYGTGG
jgi:hypothetical protein